MALADHRDFSQGNSKPIHSILAFSDKQILDRAVKLGVSLGRSENEIVKSAMLIKQSEVNRNICFLDKDLSSTEGAPVSLILSRASALTEDLVDEKDDRSWDDQSDFLTLSHTVKRTRKRKDYSRVAFRRSARVKVRSKRDDA